MFGTLLRREAMNIFEGKLRVTEEFGDGEGFGSTKYRAPLFQLQPTPSYFVVDAI